MPLVQNKKLIAFIFSAITTSTWSFQINPIKDRFELPRGMNPVHARWIENISADVHEEITRRAHLCSLVMQDIESHCTDSKINLTSAQEARLKYLRWGVEWNDDPNNLIRTNLVSVWLYWLTDAHKKKNQIDTQYALEYRSHYGDLQFLHAMASDGDTAEQTRSNVLSWAQFAYGVATGNIKPSLTLGQLQENFPFTRKFQGAKLSWTVRQLFTNVGDFKRMYADVAVDDSGIADIAAGALLHTLEDSFSCTHVTRLEATDDDEPANAITRWNNYSKQDPKCHQSADRPPEWLDGDDIGKQAVVRWSAELLRRIDARQPWSPDVEKYLTDKVFALAKNTSPEVCLSAH